MILVTSEFDATSPLSGVIRDAFCVTPAPNFCQWAWAGLVSVDRYFPCTFNGLRVL